MPPFNQVLQLTPPGRMEMDVLGCRMALAHLAKLENATLSKGVARQGLSVRVRQWALRGVGVKLISLRCWFCSCSWPQRGR